MTRDALIVPMANPHETHPIALESADAAGLTA